MQNGRMEMAELRISTTDEAPLQASKWLKSQMLIDAEEMRQLFDSMGNFHLFLSGALSKRGKGEISKEEFLKCYQAYIACLSDGKLPEPSTYRHSFSPILTKNPDALYVILMGEDQQLIRAAKPIIQLQAHNIGYSPVDGKFRSMVFGNDSIPWGIQFSYPQLFQDNSTKQVEQTRHSPQFPNTELFQILQKWVRNHTVPTPFSVSGEEMNVPIRLGKQCLSWINRHPQLVAKNISINFKN